MNNKKTLPSAFDSVPFGSIFSEHMFVMKWHTDRGWHDAKIQPHQPLQMDPGCINLHYGPSIFEGMKAFRTVGDKHIALFRPREHLTRFNRSARRMCMPEIDVLFVLQKLKELILIDQEWVPASPGTALYIRPTMMAVEKTLNLKVANEFLFFIVLSPVGALYKEGFNPTSIMVSTQYTRASVGGVGDVKTAGNYAACMLAQEEAKAQGFSQVLWLDPLERAYVEEVGAMNIFFVINNELITPPLHGTILPGITRQSIINLAHQRELPITERRISINEVVQRIDDGSLTEMFGTGTAAIVAPVGKLLYKNTIHTIHNNTTGPVAQQFLKALQDIQQGHAADTNGWLDYIT